MEALLLALLFPAVWPFIAKRIWHTSINYTEMLIQWFGICVLVAITWQAGVYGQMSDTEIWNGKVTAKKVDDGSYVRSYQCNCRSVSCGKDCTTTECDTCYEDRYTRSYDGYSTVGDWTWDSIDTTSRTRRDSFGPPSGYVNCNVGDPAAREKSYINYVQAVPQSLFNVKHKHKYYDQVPAYPRVHSFYMINRVIGISHPEAGKINEGLNNELRTLGYAKQANIVVILTDLDDPNFRHAVEQKWVGGEKNDVVVLVGLKDNDIIWADVFTWALNKGNGTLAVQLRDAVKALGTLESESFVQTVSSNIMKHYNRPEMADFEYLKDEIQPPTWVIILVAFFAIGGSMIATWLFVVYEVDDFVGDFFRNLFGR